MSKIHGTAATMNVVFGEAARISPISCSSCALNTAGEYPTGSGMEPHWSLVLNTRITSEGLTASVKSV